MGKIVYEVVPHDGGWAYRLNGAYSESFPTHAEAVEAARIVAAEQAGGFGVHLSIGAVILNLAIGYGVYWLIRKIVLSAASARAARRAR